jgi:hypothetical protein
VSSPFLVLSSLSRVSNSIEVIIIDSNNESNTQAAGLQRGHTSKCSISCKQHVFNAVCLTFSSNRAPTHNAGIFSIITAPASDEQPPLQGQAVLVLCLLQPCLENKNLGRKQTLTYLKGYQHENPDMSGLMSSDGPARPSPSRIPAGTYCGSPKSAPGSPSATGLPKWVEQNGQVRETRNQEHEVCSMGC